VPCAYPSHDGPDAGRPLPDHGDLWDQPWDVVDRGERHVTLRGTSRALPLELTRRVVLADGGVRLDYELRNLGDRDLLALWAAHPQFRCEPGTRVVLPAHVVDVVNAQEDEHGPHGARIDWPRHGGFDLDHVRDASDRACRKVYVPPEQRASWAALVAGDGRSMTLSWDAGDVPYLGVWIDEGRYSREPVCALEPCDGFFDSLADAVEAGRCASLAAATTRRWSLAIRFGGPQDGVAR
jgi:galactose mutarotase-like enzyme